MKIGLVLLNKGGGSGEVVRQYVEHLILSGHKIYFLYPFVKENIIRNAVNVDVKLHSDIIPVHEYLPWTEK